MRNMTKTWGNESFREGRDGEGLLHGHWGMWTPLPSLITVSNVIPASTPAMYKPSAVLHLQTNPGFNLCV
jgi:hypothetical protein